MTLLTYQMQTQTFNWEFKGLHAEGRKGQAAAPASPSPGPIINSHQAGFACQLFSPPPKSSSRLPSQVSPGAAIPKPGGTETILGFHVGFTGSTGS